MTRRRNDDKSTEFGLWLRGQLPHQNTDVKSIGSRRSQFSRGYDINNLDYIILQYMDDCLMLLEEKRYGANQRFNQAESHKLIDQALRFACAGGCLFWRVRPPPRPLKYYGYHIITFENTNPEDGWTKVDDVQVTIDEFLAFLRFELMPDGIAEKRKAAKSPHLHQLQLEVTA